MDLGQKDLCHPKKNNNKKCCIPKIKTGIKSVLVGSLLLCTSLQNRQLYCD